MDDLIQKIVSQGKPKKTTAQDLINLSLGSNQSWIDKQQSRRQQDSTSAARRNSSVVLSSSNSTPTGAGGSGNYRSPGAPVARDNVQKLAQSMAMSQHNWSGPEWDALVDLIERESGWNPDAQNPTSSAGGLFQFLDSTRANYGITQDSPLQDQIRAGLQYIADRYQTPSRALSHWMSRVPIDGRDVGNWY